MWLSYLLKTPSASQMLLVWNPAALLPCDSKTWIIHTMASPQVCLRDHLQIPLRAGSSRSYFCCTDCLFVGKCLEDMRNVINIQINVKGGEDTAKLVGDWHLRTRHSFALRFCSVKGSAVFCSPGERSVTHRSRTIVSIYISYPTRSPFMRLTVWTRE